MGGDQTSMVLFSSFGRLSGKLSEIPVDDVEILKLFFRVNDAFLMALLPKKTRALFPTIHLLFPWTAPLNRHYHLYITMIARALFQTSLVFTGVAAWGGRTATWNLRQSPVANYLPRRYSARLCRQKGVIKTSLWSVASSPVRMESFSSSSSFESSKNVSTWLVVGDGDLSYSATVARELEEHDKTRNTQLIATVLEDQERHNQIYRDSCRNSEIIQFASHSVRFGVDATHLEESFDPHSVDRITFNFPHWPGKNNHRRNRQLMYDFFQSCSRVVSKEKGEVHVTLRRGQSGWEETSLEAWKRTWMVPMLANDAGLLLERVESFQVEYRVSSFRGKDQPFYTEQDPKRFVFRLPGDSNTEYQTPIEEHYQMACRHEIRVVWDTEQFAKHDILESDFRSGNFLLSLVQDELLPRGYRAEMPLTDLKEVGPIPGKAIEEKSVTLFIGLLVYRGESSPLTRAKADEIRSRLELIIEERYGLTVRKKNHPCSKPFPYHLLDCMLEAHEC